MHHDTDSMADGGTPGTVATAVGATFRTMAVRIAQAQLALPTKRPPAGLFVAARRLAEIETVILPIRMWKWLQG